MRNFFCVLVLFSVPSLAAEADPVPAVASTGYVSPRVVPKQNLADFYPGIPDREALVYVGFLLGTDGRAVSPVVMEGGFHDKRFEDAALRMVSRIRFIPAMRDGVPEPAWQSLPVRFGIDGSRGITPEFRREMAKVVRLTQAKDYAGAHFHAQWMLAEKVTLSYEFAVLNYTIADTQARMGNIHRALAASREATGRFSMSMEKYEPGGPIPTVSENDYILSKGVLQAALKLRFGLAASQGFLLDALRTHADLQGLGAISADDPTMAVFRQLLELYQTSPTLASTIRIDEVGYWDHEPVHRRLMVLGVQGGKLERILLRCRGEDTEIPFSVAAEWSIPKEREGCRLRFHGTPGTQFKLMELRDLPG